MNWIASCCCSFGNTKSAIHVLLTILCGQCLLCLFISQVSLANSSAFGFIMGMGASASIKTSKYKVPEWHSKQDWWAFRAAAPDGLGGGPRYMNSWHTYGVYDSPVSDWSDLESDSPPPWQPHWHRKKRRLDDKADQ